MIEYTVNVYDNGDKEWYLNGQRHCEDGPAVEWADGSKEWWINGQLHREDGTAYEGFDGHKVWYLNGKLHREDGPAIEYASGYKVWYLNGQELTEKEFNKRVNPKSCAGKVIEIEGKKYKLTAI